jgi:hypothetical protein
MTNASTPSRLRLGSELENDIIHREQRISRRKTAFQLMTEPMSHRHDGRTRSAVERIAAFAAAARPEHLTTNIRQLSKRKH